MTDAAAVADTIPAPVLAPDPRATYEKARECAIEHGNTALGNAYWMLADTLRELEDERSRSARLRTSMHAVELALLASPNADLLTRELARMLADARGGK